jgi:FMN-dependent NADH-azoreductase
MNILHIDSCPLGDHSASCRFGASAVAALLAATPPAQAVYRDVAATPLSHVSGPLLQVMRQQWNNAIPMNAELRAEALQSESLLQEFLDADVVVLGAPMYNFTIPSTLKAWLDRLLQAGRTFELHADGPHGMLSDKRVVLVSSSCCRIGGPAHEALICQQEAHLKALFGFMGISQVEVVRADANQDIELGKLLALAMRPAATLSQPIAQPHTRPSAQLKAA